MSLSQTHKDAIDAAAAAFGAANLEVKRLQSLQNAVPPEGLQAYIAELSKARAEEVAAARVLEAIVRSA